MTISPVIRFLIQPRHLYATLYRQINMSNVFINKNETQNIARFIWETPGGAHKMIQIDTISLNKMLSGLLIYMEL